MFVVFEGIDGSGKTTVSNRVVKRLTERGLSVKHVRAEGKFASSVTEAVRALARDVKNLELVPKAEFLLYVAREVQLVEEALLPALSTHDVVIADRFLYTAEVLARSGRRLGDDFIDSVLRVASAELMPDLCVLVDVDPALARARRRASKLEVVDTKPPSRKGLAGTGLQHRLREGYARLAASAPERWAVIGNDAALETTVERVTNLIQSSRESGVSRTLVEFRENAPERAHPEGTLADASAALAAFLAWLTRRAETEPAVAAQFLAGFWGSAVDELRVSLAERAPLAVLSGATGLIDDSSFRLRERLLDRYPAAVARSLSGIPNDDVRARELREQLAERAGAEVAMSLNALGDEAADALRERLYERYPDEVMGSLGALDTPRAWEIRDRWLSTRRDRLGESYELAKVAARSVRRVPGDRAWEVREISRAAAPVEALRSIAALSDERSFHWRSQALRRAPKPVMETLSGLSSPETWEMRRRVAADCREALEGFSGADVSDAWDLRDRYADVWPCSVVKSLGTLASSQRGDALLKRQLSHHGSSLNVRRHAAAIALGVNKNSTLWDE